MEKIVALSYVMRKPESGSGLVVRTVVRKIADTPGMLTAFLSPKRNQFLEAWTQAKTFVHPPMPN